MGLLMLLCCPGTIDSESHFAFYNNKKDGHVCNAVIPLLRVYIKETSFDTQKALLRNKHLYVLEKDMKPPKFPTTGK